MGRGVGPSFQMRCTGSCLWSSSPNGAAGACCFRKVSAKEGMKRKANIRPASPWRLRGSAPAGADPTSCQQGLQGFSLPPSPATVQVIGERGCFAEVCSPHRMCRAHGWRGEQDPALEGLRAQIPTGQIAPGSRGCAQAAGWGSSGRLATRPSPSTLTLLSIWRQGP